MFASLPPVLHDVRGDLGLSAGVAGLLTTGPVLCFGAFALLAPRIVRRVPIERVLAGAAALTAVGAALRGAGGVLPLFAGTLVAGAAVAIAQTVLPILVRTRFPLQAGSLTGAFSMALTLGSAVAAGLAVPLEHALGGWRGSLAAFGVPAALAALLWLTPSARTTVPRAPGLALHRLPGSWSVAVYFGLQSMAFYAGLTWLPTILQANGWSESAAGGLQALANVVQFGPAFLVPMLAGRRRNQTPLLVVLVVAALAAVGGLLVAPGAAVAWMPLLGLAQGGALGLALILPVLRGGDSSAVAALTAMALCVGYLIAATGPFLLGVAHDVSGGWTVPLVLLLAIVATEFVGVAATRDWTVGGDP